jgi:hypothetical protein
MYKINDLLCTRTDLRADVDPQFTEDAPFHGKRAVKCTVIPPLVLKVGTCRPGDLLPL